MNLFYTSAITDDRQALLEEEEWRHCHRVLRRRQGDQIFFVDGMGNYYEGHLSEITKNHGKIQINRQVENWNAKPYKVHIAVAPTKNAARIEWALEKMVEFGIDSISFLQTEHSERPRLKYERLRKIAIGAMKQSKQAKLVDISEIMPFSDFLELHKDSASQMRLAHLSEDSSSLCTNYQKGNDVIILVGPEGDFSEAEIDMARQHQIKLITLGSTRLRTETAALAACHTIHVLNEKE